ncbi:MAG: ribonuclease III, partial [Massilia sp.]
YGRGGSRRAGEQAAAKLALEVAQQALLKTPAATRKAKPRAAQLKLAGIATSQRDSDIDGGAEPVAETAADKSADKTVKPAAPAVEPKPAKAAAELDAKPAKAAAEPKLTKHTETKLA